MIARISIIGSAGFPAGSVVKNMPSNTGDLRDAGLTPGSGRSLATTAALMPGKSPWTEKLAGLQSMGSQRVRHGLKRLSMHTHLGKGLRRFRDKKYKEVSGFQVPSKKRSQLRDFIHHSRLLN